MPAQAVQGATREGPPGTGGGGLSSETHLLVCMVTNGGSNTQNTVPYPPQPHSPPHSASCPHTVSVAVPIER